MQFITNASGLASDGGDVTTRFIYNNSTGFLMFDADGAGGSSGAAVARFVGLPAIGIADFTVVS